MSKSRKSRAESFTQACKQAAKEWDEKCGVVADPKRPLRKAIKAVQVLINQAGVELGRACRNEGDVQSAFDKRQALINKRSKLNKQLYAL